VITSIDLQQLARLRLSEAEALYEAGFYDGCSYLCGYAVELALKACICKTLSLSEYPEKELGKAFLTHDFDALQLLSGLRSQIAAERNASIQFNSNWSLCTTWKPEQRYVISGKTQQDALDLLDALRSSPEGVLVWLSQKW